MSRLQPLMAPFTLDFQVPEAVVLLPGEFLFQGIRKVNDRANKSLLSVLYMADRFYVHLVGFWGAPDRGLETSSVLWKISSRYWLIVCDCYPARHRFIPPTLQQPATSDTRLSPMSAALPSAYRTSWRRDFCSELWQMHFSSASGRHRDCILPFCDFLVLPGSAKESVTTKWSVSWHLREAIPSFKNSQSTKLKELNEKE